MNNGINHQNNNQFFNDFYFDFGNGSILSPMTDDWSMSGGAGDETPRPVEGADYNILNEEQRCIEDGLRSFDGFEYMNDGYFNEKIYRDKTLLMLCAKYHREDVIKHIFSTQALIDPNITDNQGQTALVYAIESGAEAIVSLLISKSAGVNVEDRRCKSPLMHAASTGNLKVVEGLCENGANVNACDIDGQTPLMYAARGKCVRVLEELVKRGAKVNATDFYGRTALIYAAKAGNNKIVDAFNKMNDAFEGIRVDLNISDRDKLNARDWAAVEGHIETFVKLEKWNAEHDVPVWEFQKNEIVAQKFLKKMYSYLIEHESCEEWRGICANLMFRLAFDEKDWDFVRHIINSRHLSLLNNPFIEDDTAVPLVYAVLKGGRQDHWVAIELLKAGQNPNFWPASNDNLLNVAAVSERSDIVDVLCADINDEEIEAEGAGGCTALHCAAIGGNVDIGRRLLEKGARRDVKSNDNYTPLDLAIMHGHAEFIELLLDEDVDLDVKMEIFNEALVCSVQFGCSVEKTGRLLDLGANINHVEDGLSLIGHVAYFGRGELLRYLVDRLTSDDVGNQRPCNEGLNEFGLEQYLCNKALSAALKKSNYHCIEDLLKLGAKIELSELHAHIPSLIVRSSGRDVMRVLYDKFKTPNSRTVGGLPYFIVNGQEFAVDWLDVIERYEENKGLLGARERDEIINAAHSKEVEKVDVRLEFSLNFDLIAFYGAVRAGDFEVVDALCVLMPELINKPLGISDFGNNPSYPAVTHAAKEGRAQVLEVLLKHGAKHEDGPEVYQGLGVTNPGHTFMNRIMPEAIVQDHANVLDVIKNNPSWEIQGVREDFFKVWLKHSAVEGAVKMGQALIELGDIKGEKLKDIVFIASSGGRGQFLVMLYNQGAEINFYRNDWILKNCILREELDAVAEMFEFMDNEVWAHKIKRDLMMWLVTSKDRLNYELGRCEARGRNKLGFIDIDIQKKSIDLLIQLGVNVNVVDVEGRTALMHAICEGNHELVKHLLGIGADVDILDEQKRGALYYAMFYQRDMMVEDIINARVEGFARPFV